MKAIEGHVQSSIGERKMTHGGILGTVKGFLDVNEERLDDLAGILDLSTSDFQHTGTQSVARRAITRAYGEIEHATIAGSAPPAAGPGGIDLARIGGALLQSGVLGKLFR